MYAGYCVIHGTRFLLPIAEVEVHNHLGGIDVAYWCPEGHRIVEHTGRSRGGGR